MLLILLRFQICFMINIEVCFSLNILYITVKVGISRFSEKFIFLILFSKHKDKISIVFMFIHPFIHVHSLLPFHSFKWPETSNYNSNIIKYNT